MPFDAASQERVPDPRLRGMNPAFVQSVWKKRREEEKQRLDAIKEAELVAREAAPQPRPGRPSQKAKQVCEDILAKYRAISVLSDLPSGKDIIKGVCERHGVSMSAILGHNRQRRIVAVRQQAMVEVYETREDYSLSQIGRLFNRDHTTILAALKKHGAHVSQTGAKRDYMDTHQQRRAA